MKLDLSKPWAGMVPITMVVRNPEQPRKTFPKQEITALAGSMKLGTQVTPVAVMPHAVSLGRKDPGEVLSWMIVDGEMRWRAAKEAGLGEVLVCYRPGINTENLHRVSFAANFCRTAHTKHETAMAIDKEHAAGKSYEEIGQMVGKSSAWALTHHQLLQLHPDLLRFLDEPDPFTNRKLAMKVALLFVGQPHDRQLAVYKRHRNKTSQEQYHAARSTAVVKSERGPADDLRYLEGLILGATGKLITASQVGEVMLRRFTPEQLKQLGKGLDRVLSAVDKVNERLGKHTGRTD